MYKNLQKTYFQAFHCNLCGETFYRELDIKIKPLWELHAKKTGEVFEMTCRDCEKLMDGRIE